MCTCPRDPRVLRRCYSAAAAIFDRHLKARQRRWASVQEEYGAAGALRDEVGARLLDSVKVPRCAAPRAVLTRKDLAHPPRDVLVLGPHCSRLVDGLATLPAATTTADGADEEQWAFPKGAFDMIIANLNLHWVNDLEGVCGSVAGSLRENSSFLGALLGGDTLFELRCARPPPCSLPSHSSALLLAQQEIEGGVSPRISPMICKPPPAGRRDLTQQRSAISPRSSPRQASAT